MSEIQNMPEFSFKFGDVVGNSLNTSVTDTKDKLDLQPRELRNFVVGLVNLLNSINGADSLAAKGFDNLKTTIQAMLNDLNTRKLDATGDFKGTLNGMPIVAADPGLSSIVAYHTSQLNDIAIFYAEDLGILADGITDETEKLKSIFNKKENMELRFKIYGSTILVSNQIDLNTKNVKIVGNNTKIKVKDNTLTQTCKNEGTYSKSVLYVNADNITIENIEIDGNKDNNYVMLINPVTGLPDKYYCNMGGFTTTASGSAFGYTGLTISGSDALIKNCIIHDVTWACGRAVGKDDANRINNIVIDSCVFYTSPEDHFPIHYANDVTIKNCTSLGVTHHGFHPYENCSHIRIINNKLDGSDTYKFNFMPNSISQDNCGAIMVEHSGDSKDYNTVDDVIIENNHIYGNFTDGIGLLNYAKNTVVKNNTIEDCYTAVHVFDILCDGNLVVNNIIKNVTVPLQHSISIMPIANTKMQLSFVSNTISIKDGSNIVYISTGIANVDNNIVNSHIVIKDNIIVGGIMANLIYFNENYPTPTKLKVIVENNSIYVTSYTSITNKTTLINTDGTSITTVTKNTRIASTLPILSLFDGTTDGRISISGGKLILSINGTTVFTFDIANDSTTLGGMNFLTASALRCYPLTADPSPKVGGLYYNSSTGKFRKCVNGTSWVDTTI